MDTLPKISIITAVFNSEKFIESTLKSILAQSYSNWELILVDDCSSDNSLKVIQPYLEKHKNFNLIKLNSNKGAAIARNEGTKIANGDFIAFLDSDDLWKPNKLSTQIKLMLNNNVDVCFSSYDLIDEQGNYLNKKVQAIPKLSYNKLLKSNYIGNLTGIYNAKKLGKIYTKNLRKRQDWLLWLEAIKRSSKDAVGLKDSLAMYRVRKNSMSSNKLNLVKHNFNVYKKGLDFSFLKSMYYLSIFLIEHIFVKSKQIIPSPKN